MLQKILKGILTFSGSIAGAAMVWFMLNVLRNNDILALPWYQEIIAYVLGGALVGMLFFFASQRLIRIAAGFIKWIDSKIQEIPMIDILLGAVGLIVGLIIAYLISFPINLIRIPWLSILLTIFIYALMSYFGISTAIKRREELNSVLWLKRPHKTKGKDQYSHMRSKILDTSVIIDGRIFDLCKTGFIEGTLVIPGFVLDELRRIADSSDQLKRNRGRRGLDILNKIQNELDVSVEICERDFEEVNDVDGKLLKLGAALNAKVLTNDYNLNKVAEFQGVTVLNINELANAIKPVVIPGEEMVVQVVKDGKETGQGVAYLDDGTMIVVDGGKKHVGETIGVMVTSVFQTAAGRMIFAKPKAVGS